MIRPKQGILLLLFGIPSMLMAQRADERINYPETRKDASVVEDYFGTKVADPYRWLEDDNSEETGQWVKDQNKVTYSILENIPYRQKINERLLKDWNYAKYSTPFKRCDYYYFYKNDGSQNHSVLYRQQGLDGKPEVVLDPNTFSKDGTTSMGSTSISKDCRYLAYSISKAGSDWQEIHVHDLQTGETLKDEVKWVKFSGISWEGKGFYYSRYDAPKEGSEYSGKNEYHQIYYHEVGKDQSEDRLVFKDGEHPLRNFYVSTTKDERYLFLFGAESTSGNSLKFMDLLNHDKATFITVVANFDYEYRVIDHIDGKILMHTNHSALKNRVVWMDPTNPDPKNWKTVIPESEDLLETASLCNGKIIARYLKDVKSRLVTFDYKGKKEGEITLPGIGVVGGFSAEKDQVVAFYSFVNFLSPSTIYKYNSATGKSEVFKAPKVNFDADKYVTKQVFYPSKDGTKIPMFITHRKDLKMDGNNPTFLYAYGGFNISIKPSFQVDKALFMEKGGIYAVANLRGGGEYGEKWHRAGTKLEKQNVFDDYIAAAEYLIKEKYTSAAKLAVHGRSNGGLLIGAVMTQRPDLFRVALPQVGVLDMLRYHKFTIGWAWATDYGSSEDETQFNNLIKYSPLHNVKKVSYPATMVITGDHDDRVVPAHSFKFAATLQEHQQGENPVLIRIDTNGGHGAGKPLSMRIEELADMWAFTYHYLGMTW